MKPDEIIRERRKNSLAYLPLGPVEWHGPHLPVGTDPLRAELAAVMLAEKTGGIVLPALFMGTERERSPAMLKNIGFSGREHIEGMDFPGNTLPSLYFREEVFAAVLRDYLGMLAGPWKFRNIVMVNGHGGQNHIAVIERLKNEFTASGSARVVHVLPLLDHPVPHGGHADREETETFMACYPGCVDLGKLPEKPAPLHNLKYAIVDSLTFRGRPTADFTVRVKQDPRDAAPESGRKVFEKTVEQMKTLILSELAPPGGKRGAGKPRKRRKGTRA